jgi:citrate lyase beta subunit
VKRGQITPFHLGASLYIPSIHKNVFKVVLGERFSYLKSVIVCLEDSILDSQVEEGEENLKSILREVESERELLIFARPRNWEHLQKLLTFKNIERLDGFVLPKIDVDSFQKYSNFLKEEFYFMPTIESEIVFNKKELGELKQELVKYRGSILSIRFGSEDIGKVLRIKRGCNKTIYEIPIFSKAMTNLISIFKPAGFNITSPVFACYEDMETLQREVESDLENGVFGKSAIHPKQIEEIEKFYRVSQKDLSEAKKVLEKSSAVEGFNGAMIERKTHFHWAEDTVLRSVVYGVES